MRKILAFIIISSILITFSTQIGISESEDWYYVSHPGNIPDFKNYTTPQLKPGEDDIFNFTVMNRYDKDINNVTLNVEIYRFATIHTSKEINKIGNPAIIRKTGTTNATFNFNNNIIDINESKEIKFEIITDKNTAEGTYFIRCLLTFNYNNSKYLMKSRGFFSEEEWDSATENATENDPGNINLTMLGVDGIIPDSTFGVKNPIPRWPLYVLIFLTIFFAVLAIVFYIEDTQSSPWLNKRIQRMRGKFNQFRRFLKHRKN